MTGTSHDCFTKRKTNALDNLLEKLNNFHPSKKTLTTSWTPFNHQEGNFTTRVYLRNQVNYKYTGNRLSQRGESATLF